MHRLLTAGTKHLLVAGALDEALFAQTKDTDVLPVDLDETGEEEGLLADLVSLLNREGFGTNGITIVSISPGAGECTPPTTCQRTRRWGEAGQPAASTLDPTVVLATHPMVWAALGSWALAQVVF